MLYRSRLAIEHSMVSYFIGGKLENGGKIGFFSPKNVWNVFLFGRNKWEMSCFFSNFSWKYSAPINQGKKIVKKNVPIVNRFRESILLRFIQSKWCEPKIRRRIPQVNIQQWKHSWNKIHHRSHCNRVFKEHSNCRFRCSIASFIQCT